jgi:hypothetical protein
MVTRENGRANRAMSELAEVTRETCRALADGAFAIQQQNAKLALSWVEHSVEALRDQAEANRETMQVLVQQSEKQQEALQTLAGESVRAGVDFLFSLLSPYRQEPRTEAREDGADDHLPIENYGELTVAEISEKLGDLSTEEIEQLKVYEKKYKNRTSLLERFDRALG